MSGQMPRRILGEAFGTNKYRKTTVTLLQLLQWSSNEENVCNSSEDNNCCLKDKRENPAMMRWVLPFLFILTRRICLC